MKRFIPIFLIAASVQAKVFNVTDTVVRVRTAASTSLTEAASIEYANSVGLTATPVYVESDPIWVANSNLYSLTGADTNYTLKVGDTMTGTHTYTNAILYIAEATNDASPVTYRQLGATRDTQFVFASGIKLIDLTTNLQVVLPGGSLTNLFN